MKINSQTIFSNRYLKINTNFYLIGQNKSKTIEPRFYGDSKIISFNRVVVVNELPI